MLQKLFYWDYASFTKVHLQWHNAVLDFIMPFIRNAYFWAPLYIFLLIFTIQSWGKKAFNWIFFFILTFAIADFFSGKILKTIFRRTRPCIDPMWMNDYRHLVPTSHGYSFPSTHATNHFALAIFIIITLGHINKNIKYLAILWAASIAYAQVYVGVHYPLDVIAGALLGTWIGYLTGNFYKFKTALV